MKVEFIQTMAGPKGVFAAGEVHEVSTFRAGKLIAANIAVEFKEVKAPVKKAVKKTTKKK